MTLEQWAAVVRDLGFPIFVAVFILVRVDRTLKHLTESLVALNGTIHEKLSSWNGRERRRGERGSP